ncbi:MAG: hypothetical protein EOM20_06175 [Spartobacteria bacterium]|nr:hypothetical protein [Spartobacteria bacterium]
MARNTRRKQNKKKQTEKRHVFPVPLAGILVLAAVLSLTYLWLCGRCDSLGRRIKVLEKSCAEARKLRYNEEYKWANMKNPRNIERALKQHHLDMTWPDRRRVITLSSRLCELDDVERAEARNDGAARMVRMARNDG